MRLLDCPIQVGEGKAGEIFNGFKGEMTGACSVYYVILLIVEFSNQTEHCQIDFKYKQL